jgi:hypothetical protein
MAKKNTTSRKSKSKARKSVLERINPNAAGIDIGAKHSPGYALDSTGT